MKSFKQGCGLSQTYQRNKLEIQVWEILRYWEGYICSNIRVCCVFQQCFVHLSWFAYKLFCSRNKRYLLTTYYYLPFPPRLPIPPSIFLHFYYSPDEKFAFYMKMHKNKYKTIQLIWSSLRTFNNVIQGWVKSAWVGWKAK